MASSGKRKTTMAKMNRERKLIERRVEKQARKDARKRAAASFRAAFLACFICRRSRSRRSRLSFAIVVLRLLPPAIALP